MIYYIRKKKEENTMNWKELQFYVMIENRNTPVGRPTYGNIEFFNIFNSYRFRQGLDLFFSCNDSITKENLIEELKGLLYYCFGSKCEYEIYVKRLFDEKELTKIDVYHQILPNIDLLVNMILNSYKKL